MISRSLTDGGRLVTKTDMALALSLLAVAILSGFFVDANRPDTIEPATWWHWFLLATPPLLVAVRRINPVLVTIVATVAQSAIWVSNLPEVLLPVIVILYTASADDDRRGLQVSVAASVALTIVTGIGVSAAADVTLYQLPLIVLTCGTAIALGANAARQRRIAGQLAREVTEVRLRGEHDRTQAVSAERSHIARELHDIIGHTLSVIAVRAEAADRVAGNRPEVAGEAVTDIASAARSALSETRRVLAGLRQSGAGELAPAPDLEATRRLVTDLAEAGVAATFTESGCQNHEPPAVVVGGVYRIVQESLTNAIKHGGPEVTVVVELTCRRNELEVRVTNSLGEPPKASDSDISGAGLIGMAERAAILGGSFTAERTDKGFVVHARLPTGLAATERPAR